MNHSMTPSVSIVALTYCASSPTESIRTGSLRRSSQEIANIEKTTAAFAARKELKGTERMGRGLLTVWMLSK